jgi:hypothetical protein
MSKLMQFTFADNEGPPAGIYKASFAGVEPTTHDEYGEGARWEFKVSAGEHEGKVSSRTTKRVPGANNLCGRFMAAVIGRQMARGEQVNLAPYVGRIYTIVVADAPNGKGTRVESVVAA